VSRLAFPKRGLKSCVRLVTWAAVTTLLDVSLFRPSLPSLASLFPHPPISSLRRQLLAFSSGSTVLEVPDLILNYPLRWRADRRTWLPSLPASCSEMSNFAHSKRPNSLFRTVPRTGCHHHILCRSRVPPSIKTSMSCSWDAATDEFSYGGCAVRPGNLTATFILILIHLPYIA
jgi:hypothetical protein